MIKHLWFKRKVYGWGWMPCSWEGWVVTLGFVILLIPVMTRMIDWTDKLLSLAILVIILIGICYKTGEKPRWQWG